MVQFIQNRRASRHVQAHLTGMEAWDADVTTAVYNDLFTMWSSPVNQVRKKADVIPYAGDLLHTPTPTTVGLCLSDEAKCGYWISDRDQFMKTSYLRL